MKLLLISPEGHDERELPALPRFFALGLEHYHLRKPEWDRARLATWLGALPAEFHARIILHTHHDLATDFAVGGLHFRRSTDIPVRAFRAPPPFTSRACHDPESLHAALGHHDRVLLSPIFPSLSKPGHAPSAALAHATIAAALAARSAEERRTEVVALGGIDAARLPVVHALGFDAAALLGAVWQTPDPVAAFSHLRSVSSDSVRSVLSVVK